jgi:predicted dehydrogenase
MKRKLKVGVIGVGAIGKTHLQALTSRSSDLTSYKNTKVIAIADINKEALKSAAEEFNIDKIFTDYHKLLALELDAVCVCTPPFTHATITCDAASAGKHVLCEKPMALNSAEAKEMVKACYKSGVKLGICSARSRFSPSVERAKTYIIQGKLGQIYYARTTALRRKARPGIDFLKASKWFLDSSKAGGGALIDMGCYDIDVMLYLLGDVQPSAVSAITFQGIGETLELETVYDVEEHSSVFVKFKEDLAVTFEASWAANMVPYNETVILGSKGSLKLNPFTYYTEENRKDIATTIDLSRNPREEWNQLMKDFVTACLEDRKPKTPGEEGLKVMQIIEMAYRSAKLNKEVRLRDL